ncbi:MAG: FAD-dependent oxidoreductase [Gammaproteobacteria bacterium]|nr:FAD-dependent oxidoreductase [Gammaproteobacteria bacterium]
MTTRKQIVIIGANFGGLTAALRLRGDDDVIVIDPSPHFEFLPNIHELLSGVKSPEQLRLSRQRLLQRAGHRFIQDAVVELNPADGFVQTHSGESIQFDICVVAVGGVNNTFGVPGADEFSFPFKSVDQCHAIGNTLREKFAHQEQVTIGIVGGGLEGVESLGEILRRYRDTPGLTVHLIDSSDQLLSGLPARLGQAVQRRCRNYPVNFHTGTRVQAVTETAIELTSGENLPVDITIWTGGATAPDFLFESGLAPEADSWAPVHQTLQSRFFDNVFVIGDAAELPQPLSKQAYFASDMGECVAENIARFIQNEQLSDFQPSTNLSLISLGDLDTYLVIGNTVVAGTALSAVKEFVYQFNMARYEPPLSLLSFVDLQIRFWRGVIELGLPNWLSPRSLLRLGYIRPISF